MCTCCADPVGASLPFPPSQGSALQKEGSSCGSMSNRRRFVEGVVRETSTSLHLFVLLVFVWLQEELYKEYLDQSVGNPFAS